MVVGATLSATGLKAPFTTSDAFCSVVGYLCATVLPKASNVTCPETIILSWAALALPSPFLLPALSLSFSVKVVIRPPYAPVRTSANAIE
jgi:hypothetical protein